MRNASALIFVVILRLATVSPAHAQDEGTKTPVAYNQVVSASPILSMFKWFNVEYERKINPTTTWSVSGSFFPIGDITYRNATLQLRYYPQRAVFTGFYLGATTGVYGVGNAHDRAVVYGAGTEVGYAWLFGSDRNVGVSVGLGATRLFGGDLSRHSLTIPTIRLLNVGIAF